VASDLIG